MSSFLGAGLDDGVDAGFRRSAVTWRCGDDAIAVVGGDAVAVVGGDVAAYW